MNQSLFCCGDELISLREHGEQVLVYRKRALNDAADHMDSTEAANACPAVASAVESLRSSFFEARVLAIGGLEVLRWGLQDLSCQVCWASEEKRSQQVARVVREDLEAVMRRLSQLRYALPSWEPCMPSWWKTLAAPSNEIDVCVRRGERILSLRQWMESIAVALTAVAGEFQSLSYILQTSYELSMSSRTLDGLVPMTSTPVHPSPWRKFPSAQPLGEPFDPRVLQPGNPNRALIFVCRSDQAVSCVHLAWNEVCMVPSVVAMVIGSLGFSLPT